MEPSWGWQGRGTMGVGLRAGSAEEAEGGIGMERKHMPPLWSAREGGREFTAVQADARVRDALLLLYANGQSDQIGDIKGLR